MHDLTPKQIVTELDRYIVGQDDAKRAVAIAIRNRWRRQRVDDDMRNEVAPKNILMIGPTGVGKTEIARRLATLTGPLHQGRGTKYTEVGYYGRDVESMVRELVENAIGLVREQNSRASSPKPSAASKSGCSISWHRPPVVRRRHRFPQLPRAPRTNAGKDASDAARRRNGRPHGRNRRRAADPRDDDPRHGPGRRRDGFRLQGMLEKILPKNVPRRQMTVAEARRVLFEQECEAMINSEKVNAQAIELAENVGIIFVDEMDKVVASEGGRGADVSRQGVQHDLLPIVEGTVVITRYGYVRTDHVLFIAAGAFHRAKPTDLMPELQGRFPIRVELKDLTKDDFVRILTEPKSSLTKQYRPS